MIDWRNAMVEFSKPLQDGTQRTNIKNGDNYVHIMVKENKDGSKGVYIDTNCDTRTMPNDYFIEMEIVVG